MERVINREPDSPSPSCFRKLFMGVFLQRNAFLFWSTQPATFTFTQVKTQTTGLLPEASEVMFKLCEIKGDCLGFSVPFSPSGVGDFLRGREVILGCSLLPKGDSFSVCLNGVCNWTSGACSFLQANPITGKNPDSLLGFLVLNESSLKWLATEKAPSTQFPLSHLRFYPSPPVLF